MKKILLYILTVSFLYGCKTDNNYENNSELCALLNEMYQTDQSIRALPELTDSFFEILDSIRFANDLDRETYMKLGKEEQLAWGKIAREIADKRPKASEQTRDSLWKIQSQIDRKNTRTLIDITKNRGWVSKAELGCEEYISPVIIFRHAPKEFWPEIRQLIDKEFTENRMGEGDYSFIDNHIKGRPLDWNPNDKSDLKILEDQ
ncbi:hypothetical protein [Croceivirga sp. JEA036]|uniref:hypothetical protein n=1 Tax=Croceivirga sp. JEA036 TaxID=2721162 RepID=UPI00143B5D2A|nr:hypothetical protein [Croceivirga sp. JEA036]NJB38202.1 hypothetical protein [Croceivirga sp. JEA036]